MSDTEQNAYNNLIKWSPAMITLIWEYLEQGICPELIGQKIAERDDYKTGQYMPYIHAARYMQENPQLRGNHEVLG
jgi:hypothetical protein